MKRLSKTKGVFYCQNYERKWKNWKTSYSNWLKMN